MKILFCIGSLEKGGAERVISNLANTFSQNEDIDIVTTIDRVEYELNQKVKLHSLDEKNGNVGILNKLFRVKKLYKLIKKIKPNIIVTFLPEPSYRVLLLRKFIKLPIIVSVRNDPKIEYSTFKRKVLMKLLYPLADGFVFQTEEAKDFFSKEIQTKSVIIPNPIKKEFLERKIYEGKRDNIIVSVGRLEEQKNHELLIDAFYKLNKEIKDYKLVIYGEGSLRAKLEKKIKELNMQDRILLPGIVDNVPEKIERAKLFTMSSNYEGMPNALMEAMALGLICVSTDCPCGGPRFLINDGVNGFLFELKNKCELAKIIKKILKEMSYDELKRIMKNARESTLNLREEKINNIWHNYIYEIIKKYNTREELNEKY